MIFMRHDAAKCAHGDGYCLIVKINLGDLTLCLVRLVTFFAGLLVHFTPVQPDCF